MWLAIGLSVGMVALMAICCFAVDFRDPEQRGVGAGLGDGLRTPLGRAASTDQVVFEVEHHIDAELRSIARGHEGARGDLDAASPARSMS